MVKLKRIFENDLYAELYLKEHESTLDAADIAFLCAMAKTSELKDKYRR